MSGVAALAGLGIHKNLGFLSTALNGAPALQYLKPGQWINQTPSLLNTLKTHQIFLASLR